MPYRAPAMPMVVMLPVPMLYPIRKSPGPTALSATRAFPESDRLPVTGPIHGVLSRTSHVSRRFASAHPAQPQPGFCTISPGDTSISRCGIG